MPNLNNNKNLWIGIAVVVVLIIIFFASRSEAPTTQVTAPEVKTTPVTPTKTKVTTGTGSTSVPPTDYNHVVISKYALDGKSFRIAQFDNTVIPAEETYTVAFNDGKMTAKICNTISGPYTETTGTLTAKLMKTTMGCSSPADINATEQIFGNVFTQVVSYTLSSGTLSLSGDGHSVILVQQ
jgi:heat shock protein HslJ